MRTIVMSFFVLLLTFFTGFAYNQWSEQPLDRQFSVTTDFGEKTVVVQELSVPTTNRLVPMGAILGQDDVTTIYYKYLVKSEEDIDLGVVIDEAYFIKNETKYLDEYNLLVFDYTIEETSDLESIVTIAVSLNMPENKTQYDLVSGSQITFNLKFNQL